MLALSVYCTSRTAHLSMPVTGLLMLEEQGRVRLSFELDRSNRRRFPYAPLLGVDGGGKHLLFDLADGYGSGVEQALPRLAPQPLPGGDGQAPAGAAGPAAALGAPLPCVLARQPH